MEGQCLATKAIMEGRVKVGYMFREAPDFDGDTGWRMFTGNESLDFIDQDDNIEIYEISAITKICLLYTSPSPRDATLSRMPSSA